MGKKIRRPKRMKNGVRCCRVTNPYGVWVVAHSNIPITFTCPKCKKTLDLVYR